MSKAPQIPNVNSENIKAREHSLKTHTYEENHNIEKDHFRKLTGFEMFTIIFFLAIVMIIIGIMMINR